MPSDFLLFSANLPDFKFEEKLDGLQSRDKTLSLLESTRLACLSKMFDFTPIDKQGIERLAASFGRPKNVGELASVLSSIKPGALEAQLRAFVKTPPSKGEAADLELAKKQKADPVEFAFSYFLYCLWKTASPSALSVQQKGSPQKKEVRFAASQQSWVVVKKVDLEKAEAKEVLFALAGIFSSINKKIPDFAADNPEGYGAFVSSFLDSFPVRKSFAKLSILLKEAASREPSLSQFASDAGKLSSLKQCYYLSCFEHAGFTPFVSLESIAGVYPELKIPKPRGNFGGKKKK